MDAGGPRSGNSGDSGGPRVNERIRALQVRVISDDGEQLGVMSSQDALAKARALNLDLVEVAAQERPPVCRIMDYGKFKYQQKKRSAKRQVNKPQMKELRMRPKTGFADVQVKVNKAREVIGNNGKILLAIVYRGREIAHIEEGMKLLTSVISQLEDIAKIESPPKQLGKRVQCVLAPK